MYLNMDSGRKNLKVGFNESLQREQKTIWYKSESKILPKDAWVSTSFAGVDKIAEESGMSHVSKGLSNRKRKKPYTKSLDGTAVTTMLKEKLQNQNVFQKVPIVLNSSNKEMDNNATFVTQTVTPGINSEIIEEVEVYICPIKEEQEIGEKVFDDSSTEHHSIHEDRTKFNVISNPNIVMESDGGEDVSLTVEKSDFPLQLVFLKK